MPGSDWVESKLVLPIYVATVFYKRWWFIPLCALILLGLAYAIFRYRMFQLMKVEKMRQSISSDLHDEVGASLSSISIFSEMARQSLNSEIKAGQYLQRIGERSRESIEKMGDIVWSINPENDNLQQMLVRMKNYVNEVFESSNTLVHWEQTKNLSSLKLSMDERKNLYLLFKETITNAAKYAEAKNIYVELSSQNKKVFLKITDDGKGFSFESVKPGNGIKNMKHRARLLNGHINIESSPGNGTSVQLEFLHS
jgi:signal transduction histidine kinase